MANIKKTVKETTSILMDIPNLLYDEISKKAKAETRSSGKKCTIHFQVIDDLYKANPKVKRK